MKMPNTHMCIHGKLLLKKRYSQTQPLLQVETCKCPMDMLSYSSFIKISLYLNLSVM